MVVMSRAGVDAKLGRSLHLAQHTAVVEGVPPDEEASPNRLCEDRPLTAVQEDCGSPASDEPCALARRRFSALPQAEASREGSGSKDAELDLACDVEVASGA